MLECSDNSSPSYTDKVLALLHNRGRHNVIMMQGGHFNLDTLDTVTANETSLGILFALESLSTKFKANEPFDLRLKVGILLIDKDVRYVKATKRVTSSVCACVNALHLLESNVPLGNFLDQRFIIARSLHGVRDVLRLSQFKALADRVPEPDSLIGTCTDQELRFL
jgi:hypothetical protein